MGRGDTPDPSGILRPSGDGAQGVERRPTILVLFDIDGTMAAGRMFATCMIYAAQDALGVYISHEDHLARVKAGESAKHEMTDRARRAGVPNDRIEKVADEIISKAINLFSEELKKTPLVPLDGVEALLKQLVLMDNVAIGVVTYNMKDVTRLKLQSAGLDSYFARDDIIMSSQHLKDKPVLIGAVIAKAEVKFSTKLDRGSIFYIGDQASDVAAGRAAGIKTIGVATGAISSYDDLVKSGADAVMKDLSDTKAVMAIIEKGKTPQKSAS